jgi:hypothetical protein
LFVEGEEIRTTANHLFFTDCGWWKAAENLKVGDKILNSKGELKTLIGKSVEALQELERIYNLNVDQFHTYFVGSNGLLVHNNCTPEMMAAGREAIANARARGITDSKVLSEVGSRVADAVGDAKAIGITDATQIQRISDNAAEAVINGRKFTDPTLPKGGKPKGDYEVPTGDPETIRSLERQNQAADILADQGYDITMLKTKVGGNGYGIKSTSNPDYLIDGIAFDCYSPKSSSLYGIWKTIKDKTEQQARRIILNLEDCPCSMDDITNQFYQWTNDLPTLDELIIVKDGAVTRLMIN